MIPRLIYRNKAYELQCSLQNLLHWICTLCFSDLEGNMHMGFVNYGFGV